MYPSVLKSCKQLMRIREKSSSFQNCAIVVYKRVLNVHPIINLIRYIIWGLVFNKNKHGTRTKFQCTKKISKKNVQKNIYYKINL